MKAIEIEKIYTDKIAEYLVKGYTINPATMSGHQGEISKIDLVRGKEIVRILLSNDHIWHKVKHVPMEGITLRVLKAARPEARRPFDTWNTLWTSEMETIEERCFYQPANDSDYFTEDLDAYCAMLERRAAHWKNRKHSNGKDFDLTNPALMALAVRFLKRRTGKSRILRDTIKITKRAYSDGHNEYCVTYNNRSYALH